MAKSKKSETPVEVESTVAPASVTETPKKKAPAKPKAAAKAAKSVAKPAAKAAAQAEPTVNTSLAAETAARMIGAKAGGSSASSNGGERKETSAFKQLKQSFNKPHSAGIGNMLNSTISPAAKKSNQPFHVGKQVGHNQTFGSDASRTSVPRRTGG